MLLAAITAVRRPQLPAGIYLAPGKLHGLETLMAIAPDGEITFRTVERGTDGSEEIGQLEYWLRSRGVTLDAAAGPLLYLT